MDVSNNIDLNIQVTWLNYVLSLFFFFKDLDKECKTVQVTSEVFLETLDTFLRLLSEKIQTA